jgi:hypothetical protein
MGFVNCDPRADPRYPLFSCGDVWGDYARVIGCVQRAGAFKRRGMVLAESPDT